MDDDNDDDDDDDDDDEAEVTTINFQLYRADLSGATREAMQGPRLAELTIESGEVTGTDSVASVKKRILPRLLGERTAPHITFVISSREMIDDRLFYADHYIMLPCWIQVVLSDVPFADVLAAMKNAPS